MDSPLDLSAVRKRPGTDQPLDLSVKRSKTDSSSGHLLSASHHSYKRHIAGTGNDVISPRAHAQSMGSSKSQKLHASQSGSSKSKDKHVHHVELKQRENLAQIIRNIDYSAAQQRKSKQSSQLSPPMISKLGSSFPATGVDLPLVGARHALFKTAQEVARKEGEMPKSGDREYNLTTSTLSGDKCDSASQKQQKYDVLDHWRSHLQKSQQVKQRESQSGKTLTNKQGTTTGKRTRVSDGRSHGGLSRLPQTGSISGATFKDRRPTGATATATSSSPSSSSSSSTAPQMSPSSSSSSYRPTNATSSSFHGSLHCQNPVMPAIPQQLFSALSMVNKQLHAGTNPMLNSFMWNPFLSMANAYGPSMANPYAYGSNLKNPESHVSASRSAGGQPSERLERPQHKDQTKYQTSSKQHCLYDSPSRHKHEKLNTFEQQHRHFVSRLSEQSEALRKEDVRHSHKESSAHASTARNRCTDRNVATPTLKLPETEAKKEHTHTNKCPDYHKPSMQQDVRLEKQEFLEDSRETLSKSSFGITGVFRLPPRSDEIQEEKKFPKKAEHARVCDTANPNAKRENSIEPKVEKAKERQTPFSRSPSQADGFMGSFTTQYPLAPIPGMSVPRLVSAMPHFHPAHAGSRPVANVNPIVHNPKSTENTTEKISKDSGNQESVPHQKSTTGSPIPIQEVEPSKPVGIEIEPKESNKSSVPNVELKSTPMPDPISVPKLDLKSDQKMESDRKDEIADPKPEHKKGINEETINKLKQHLTGNVQHINLASESIPENVIVKDFMKETSKSEPSSPKLHDRDLQRTEVCSEVLGEEYYVKPKHTNGVKLPPKKALSFYNVERLSPLMKKISKMKDELKRRETSLSKTESDGDTEKESRPIVPVPISTSNVVKSALPVACESNVVNAVKQALPGKKRGRKPKRVFKRHVGRPAGIRILPKADLVKRAKSESEQETQKHEVPTETTTPARKKVRKRVKSGERLAKRKCVKTGGHIGRSPSSVILRNRAKRKITGYDKNAAYLEELRRDEFRRQFRRAKRESLVRRRGRKPRRQLSEITKECENRVNDEILNETPCETVNDEIDIITLPTDNIPVVDSEEVPSTEPVKSIDKKLRVKEGKKLKIKKVKEKKHLKTPKLRPKTKRIINNEPKEIEISEEIKSQTNEISKQRQPERELIREPEREPEREQELTCLESATKGVKIRKDLQSLIGKARLVVKLHRFPNLSCVKNGVFKTNGHFDILNKTTREPPSPPIQQRNSKLSYRAKVLHKQRLLRLKKGLEPAFRKGTEENSANTAKRQADLHRACILGQLQVAQSLLTQGANANGVASNGTLPLHEAIKGDNLEVVRLLLSYGANPYQSDSAGKVALQMVHSREMKILVKGYMSDLNGGEEEDDTKPWPFRGTSTVLDPQGETGFDVLADLPSDDEGPESDVELDLGDQPHLNTYKLRTSKRPWPANYLLLSDVLQRINMKRYLFIRHGMRRHIVTMPLRKFIAQVQTGQLRDLEEWKSRGNESGSIELVTLCKSLKNMMSVFPERVRGRRRGAKGRRRTKKIFAQNKKNASMRNKADGFDLPLPQGVREEGVSRTSYKTYQMAVPTFNHSNAPEAKNRRKISKTRNVNGGDTRAKYFHQQKGINLHRTTTRLDVCSSNELAINAPNTAGTTAPVDDNRNQHSGSNADSRPGENGTSYDIQQNENESSNILASMETCVMAIPSSVQEEKSLKTVYKSPQRNRDVRARKCDNLARNVERLAKQRRDQSPDFLCPAPVSTTPVFSHHRAQHRTDISPNHAIGSKFTTKGTCQQRHCYVVGKFDATDSGYVSPDSACDEIPALEAEYGGFGDNQVEVLTNVDSDMPTLTPCT